MTLYWLPCQLPLSLPVHIMWFLTAVIFCRIKRLSLLYFLDLIIPSLMLGQTIGRWGNFTNQEAYGNIVTDPSRQYLY